MHLSRLTLRPQFPKSFYVFTFETANEKFDLPIKNCKREIQCLRNYATNLVGFKYFPINTQLSIFVPTKYLRNEPHWREFFPFPSRLSSVCFPTIHAEGLTCSTKRKTNGNIRYVVWCLHYFSTHGLNETHIFLGRTLFLRYLTSLPNIICSLSLHIAILLFRGFQWKEKKRKEIFRWWEG